MVVKAALKYMLVGKRTPWFPVSPNQPLTADRFLRVIGQAVECPLRGSLA